VHHVAKTGVVSTSNAVIVVSGAVSTGVTSKAASSAVATLAVLATGTSQVSCTHAAVIVAVEGVGGTVSAMGV
jgi:hypothetical protein